MTIEEITVRKGEGVGGREETIATHPAFGQISLSRTSGRQFLYGSDFDHQYAVTLRIHASELHRHLSSDWPHQRKELVEVTMSEAQFATLVSSIGMGSGVQCTLRRIGDEIMPGLPDPHSRTREFSAEFKAGVQQSIDHLDALIAEIDDLGISKKKAEELKLRLRVARDRVSGSAAFVAERFDEHMEETVEQAKSEVHGYAAGLLQQAGLTALAQQGGLAALQLEGPSDE